MGLFCRVKYNGQENDHFSNQGRVGTFLYTMFSAVRLNGEIDNAYCMFCGNSESIWYTIAGEIAAKDYKILMDSGWRRHGTIIRKPANRKTCCPVYALWCDAESFQISKSQKKALRLVNNFLSGRGKFKDAKNASATITCCRDRSADSNNLTNSPQDVKPQPPGDSEIPISGAVKNLNFKRKFSSNDVKPQGDGDAGKPVDGKVINLRARKKFKRATENSGTADYRGYRPIDVNDLASHPRDIGTQVSKDSGFADDKTSVSASRPGSARRKRWQALQNRMMKRAKELGVPYEAVMQEYLTRRKKRLAKNKPKDLEDYLASEPREGEAAHFLDIRLYKSSPRSAELEATLDEEFRLYSAYQVAVHKDAPEDLKRENFIEYLVDSLIVDGRDADAEACGAPQVGTYHQQYWLDGKKLIAVGVLDLVSSGLSSVYFFYDPAYAFLRLGIYSALREIAFVRDLHRTFGSRVTAYADPMQYTLGSYVHSCAKMRYKTQFAPSYLVCPETYTMVPVEKCQRMLDVKRCTRFAEADVEKAPSVDRRNAVILLSCSPRLTSLLPSSQFTVKDNVIITSVAAATKVLSEDDSQRVEDWLKLVRSTGTMRIDCTR
uniref:Arginyl-tRNA--protein transferase 1 n=1 Tax=Echinococcus canadensis TaxID=519352 RepID=A0A915EV49_9CEST